jgi:hypothetical protein
MTDNRVHLVGFDMEIGVFCNPCGEPLGSASSFDLAEIVALADGHTCKPE